MSIELQWFRGIPPLPRGGHNIRDATSEIDLVHRETLSTKSNGSNLREMLFPRFLLLSLNHLPLQIYIYFHRFLLKSLRNWKLLVKRALLFSMKVIILGKGKEFQLLRTRIRSNKRAGIKYAFSIIVHCDSIARVRRTGRNGVIIVVIIMLRCFMPRQEIPNGIATAGQSALTMFYCYVTDRIGSDRIGSCT